MTVNEGVRSLIDKLEAAQDEYMVKDALKGFTRACGYDQFAYLQTEGLEVKTFNSYPKKWQTRYLRTGYCKIDPVVTEAKRRRGMFFWTADDWADRGSSLLRTFRDEAVQHGICSGMTMSVEGSFGSLIMLTLASSEKNAPDAGRLDATDAQQVVLAVHYYLRLVGAKTIVPPRQRLSPRENMCVRWAEKGKTAPETSLLTGIKVRTVQHNLDMAREKLNAKTLAQLIGLLKDRGIL